MPPTLFLGPCWGDLHDFFQQKIEEQTDPGKSVQMAPKWFQGRPKDGPRLPKPFKMEPKWCRNGGQK